MWSYTPRPALPAEGSLPLFRGYDINAEYVSLPFHYRIYFGRRASTMVTNKRLNIFLVILVFALTARQAENKEQEGREYNGSYQGSYLNRLAFPIGGIGAGMFCLEGAGSLSHLSVRNVLQFFNDACTF